MSRSSFAARAKVAAFGVALIVLSLLAATFLSACSEAGSSSEEPSMAQTAIVAGGDVQADQQGEGTRDGSSQGALAVKGTTLVDASGNPVQLRGISTHGLAWFPQYVNGDAFRTLRDEWHANCIRLALYTHEYGGYCSGGNQADLDALVDEGVMAATDLGMYVIIDWHVLNEQNPLAYKDQAIAFFDKMSKRHAAQSNVLYEICNEPNGSASWSDIKSYAGQVIPVIRANDPDAVVIVGTPTWSQDVDKAAADPLSFDNVMYSLHFYAATHTQWLRDRAQAALSAGLPIFVSEFGLCDASGSGANNLQEAEAWLSFLDSHNISYIAWNLSNKAETSALIASGCNKVSGWADSELSESGRWLKGWLSRKPVELPEAEPSWIATSRIEAIIR